VQLSLVSVAPQATRWLSRYGVGLASADRLPVVVRIPAGPLGSLKCAKSITQLTLCQVTTSEVDGATKLLDKACQKLQGIQNIPSQRVTDLEAAIRQLR